MQHLFASCKRLISLCLITLLVITSTITIFPSSARADVRSLEGNLWNGDVVIFKCESDCGNIMSFVEGVASGSVVTLIATGQAGTIAASTAAIGQIATTALAPLTVAAAPVLIPVAVTVAAGYAVHSLLSPHSPK